jgi:hypothetical protein
MVILLFNLLFIRGLIYLISESFLLLKLRDKIKIKFIKDLIQCPICSSFWITFLFYLSFSNIFTAIFFGFVQMGFTKIFEKTF